MNKTTLVIIGIVIAPLAVCFAISLLNVLTPAEKPQPTPTPTRITISVPIKTPLAGWTPVPGNPLISYRVIPLSTPTRKP